MPYVAVGNAPGGTTGRFSVSTSDDTDPPLSDVLGAFSPWIAGSSFQIEEVWELILQVDTPELVTSFPQYFGRRRKLGNWVFLDADLIPQTNVESSGFLVYTKSRLRKVSTWTTGISTQNQVVSDTTAEIDNCNFQTVEASLGVGGAQITVSTPRTNNALFKVRGQTKASALQDFPVKRSIPSVGIFLFPGVSIVSAEYQMAAINLAPLQSAAPASAACTVSVVGCDEEFAQFVFDQNRGAFPLTSPFSDGQYGGTEGTWIYSSAAAYFGSPNIVGSGGSLQTFSCADGGTREYFQGNTF